MLRNTQKKTNYKGFTLVEMMIAVAIIGILAAIAIPAYKDYVEKTRAYQAVHDIATMSVEIEHYFQENRVYPETLADVKFDTMIDPWGTPYQYLNLTGPGNVGARKRKNLKPLNTDFDLYSKGKDKKSVQSLMSKVSDDDVVRALDGKFINLAATF